MVYKQRNSENWWFKFTWRGQVIRESTRQRNKRVAEQIEAARKTELAKGVAGLRHREPVPTLAGFINSDFLPFVRTTFAAKVKTRAYYENGAKHLLAFDKLATEPLDAITSEKIAVYVAKRQADGLQVASVNRELQALRRMFALAVEWGKVDKTLPRVRMVSGEAHRDRVLTDAEEAVYLANAMPLIHDVATILIDCGLRPEECFRLRWSSIRDGQIEIQYGKTDNARRHIPVSRRVAAVLEMRKTGSDSPWVFPAPTKSGHIEPSSLKKQHMRACKGEEKKTDEWAVQPFPLYTLRHTCLTRWAPHMDPWTLAHLAGHRDMAITKRYVHPQADMIRAAMDRARVRTPEPAPSAVSLPASLPS